MSHMATISLTVTDLEALDEACKMLGLELARGVKQYKWYGRFMGDSPLPEGIAVEELGHCDHVIRIPGNSQAYQVGVTRSKTNPKEFILLYDWWMNGYGLVDKIGKDAGLLKQSYAIARAKKHLIKQGKKVKITKKANGNLELRAR
jgi:hypothetical protein